METSLVNIHSYFRASEHYFWRWAEDGNIIEWQNKDTLCYRDDLSAMLSIVVEEGLPPMGTILLLLGACQERSLASAENNFRSCINKMAIKAPIRQTLLDFTTQAFEFLEIIQTLPKECKQGNHRIHLLNTLFSKIPNKIPAAKARNMVDSLVSGRWDSLFVRNNRKVHLKTIATDLENICCLYSYIPTLQDLQNLLEIGAKTMPTVDLPPVEEAPMDLLDLLATDTKTLGLARLAKRLVAALSIPMRTKGASELPLGGVSDITNRGNFDRLLVSELAQDQDLLSARLVNHEALYLRREEPPDQAMRERVILIDQTIRMWGIPRLFGLSAALALGQKKKGISKQSAWGLSGEGTTMLDLSSQKGVVAALKQLHPHWHCGVALEKKLTTEAKSEGQKESFFITEEQAFHQPHFQEYFARIKDKLDFLLLVNRQGELQFYRYYRSNRKLLSRSQLDLNQLLFTPSTTPILNPKRPAHLPYALRMEDFPLRFPALQFNYRKEYAFILPAEQGVLCVSPDQRVLLWGGKGWYKGKAAKEILTYIEYGDYHFAHRNEHTIYLLVRQANTLQLYTIQLETISIQKRTVQLDTVNSYFDILYLEGQFKLFNYNKTYSVDVTSGTLAEKSSSYRDQQKYLSIKHSTATYTHDVSLIKSITNRGYSILTRIKRIYLNEAHRLCLNNWQIVLGERFLELERYDPRFAKYQEPKVSQGKRLIEENAKILFRVKDWEDGSQAFVDSRGFLHLKSSDPKIPQITMVLAINMPLTFWSSTGEYCGPQAFIPNTEKSRLIPAKQFYQDILEPFIQQLTSA